MKTIGICYTPEKGSPTDEIIGFDADDFHTALAETDHLVLASPLTETTRGLIAPEEFETLPPHAYLVNVGHGPSSTPTRWSMRCARTSSMVRDSTSPIHRCWRTTRSGDSRT